MEFCLDGDPRNVSLLTEHAGSYSCLRRLPEALRKLDQVLDITPDDVDTLTQKGNIAQAEGDLPRASAILAPLHPAADATGLLEIQVYQAIGGKRRKGSGWPKKGETHHDGVADSLSVCSDLLPKASPEAKLGCFGATIPRTSYLTAADPATGHI